MTRRYQRPAKADPAAGIRHNRGERRRACNLSLTGALHALVVEAAVLAGKSRSRFIAELLADALAPQGDKT
ncbi:MAG: hypothetical protein WA864_00580 [Acetobacteraceae bacterium]